MKTWDFTPLSNKSKRSKAYINHEKQVAKNKNEKIMRGREKWNVLLRRAGIESDL